MIKGTMTQEFKDELVKDILLPEDENEVTSVVMEEDHERCITYPDEDEVSQDIPEEVAYDAPDEIPSPIEEETKPEEMPKGYWLSDLVLKCHSCGNEEVLHPDIKGGLSITLMPVDENNKLKLACNKCKAVLELYLKEIKDTGLVNADGVPILETA